jgi:hypothetical protein
MRIFLFASLLFINFKSIAQTAIVKGKVQDFKSHKPIPNVLIRLESDNVSTAFTDSSGRFEITISNLDNEAIFFQKEGFEVVTKKLKLKPDETRTINAELKAYNKLLRETVVSGRKKGKVLKTETTTEIKIDALQSNPSGNVENNLKYQGMGVGGNSEIGSQFSVRGGSFEENLIYVNDFEIYRPMLIRNAQQEGLSFANSQLIQDMKFSSGGFSPEYGDKLSSVLDITYKKPKKIAGSVEAGFLGASGHIEGSLMKEKIRFVSGVRYRNNGYLLGAQETKGQYVPVFVDIQNDVHVQITPKLSFESLTCYSSNTFHLVPEDRTTNFGLVNMALTYQVKYDGQERDKYINVTQGSSLTYKFSDNFRIKYANTAYQINERQYYDITGEYAIGEVESDVSNANYGNLKNVFGSGVFQNWGREKYDATLMHHHLSSSFLLGKNEIKAGVKYKTETFDIYLNTWDRLDSAGYTIPQASNQIRLLNPVRESYNLQGQRYEFYAQDALKFDLKNEKSLSVLFGIRGNYWSVNKEFFVSPRIQVFYSPKKNWTIYAASGSYNQPPFIREIIDQNGKIQPNVKSQKSLHFIAGTDHILKIYDQPFKFTAEVYNKHMWDINPYQYSNVQLRYAAKNNTIAYARGIDLRLQGEFVKNTESWINLGILNTEEMDGAVFTKYRDSLGTSFYNPSLASSKIVDTWIEARGSIQRPNNQFLTFNLFFQDYLPKLPNCRVNINLVLASGLPFGVPNNEPYRNKFNLLSYKRLDMGFSFKLIGGKSTDSIVPKTSRKFIKSAWATIDIFNVVDFQNQVSLSWIQDYSGNQFAVPNYLTGRRFNARLLFNF